MIFNANNSHTAGDTIDLHGQSVEQALSILTGRIQRDQQTGQTHLHVYEDYLSLIFKGLRV